MDENELRKHYGSRFIERMRKFEEMHKEANVLEVDKAGEVIRAIYFSPLYERVEQAKILDSRANWREKK